MGEHKHRDGIRGDGFKAKQKIRERRRYVKPAPVTERWMLAHGYTKREDGRWEK